MQGWLNRRGTALIADDRGSYSGYSVATAGLGGTGRAGGEGEAAASIHVDIVAKAHEALSHLSA